MEKNCMQNATQTTAMEEGDAYTCNNTGTAISIITLQKPLITHLQQWHIATSFKPTLEIHVFSIHVQHHWWYKYMYTHLGMLLYTCRHKIIGRVGASDRDICLYRLLLFINHRFLRISKKFKLILFQSCPYLSKFWKHYHNQLDNRGEREYIPSCT